MRTARNVPPAVRTEQTCSGDLHKFLRSFLHTSSADGSGERRTELYPVSAFVGFPPTRKNLIDRGLSVKTESAAFSESPFPGDLPQ